MGKRARSASGARVEAEAAVEQTEIPPTAADEEVEEPMAAEGVEEEVEEEIIEEGEEEEEMVADPEEEEPAGLENDTEADAAAVGAAPQVEAPVPEAAREQPAATASVEATQDDAATQDAAAEEGADDQDPGDQLIPAAPATVAQAQKPRLMIKEIVLENFKSYGGKKLIGPFHKSFSSIVGPNGSGKSNTIDALLFVFGKRAKKMRLKKVSDLIHSSAKLPDPPSAKVSVTFQDIIDTGDGPEQYEIVPNSLLTVSREAFQNNQSKYYVDGKSSNFTEVTTLLRKRGVDLEHNRFLILQGEVEQISLMKPKALTPHEDGLLEYLEDIIGSNVYVEKIEEAQKAVDSLSEQRTEKLNRLRVAERNKDELDGPRKEAEAWVSAEAERLELTSLLAQSEVKKHHGSVVTAGAKLEEMKEHREEFKKRMQAYADEVRRIEGVHNTHLNDYNKIKGLMDKASQDFKEFEKQDAKFCEDIDFQEQKIQKLQAACDSEQQKAVQLVQESEKLREDVPTRQQELESAERFKESLKVKVDNIMSTLKGKAEELRPLKEEKEAELVPLAKKLSKVQETVSVAETERKYIKEKQSQVTTQMDEMKRQQAECEARLKARQQEAEEDAKKIAERKQLTLDARERLKVVGQSVEEAQKEASVTRTKAEEARSQAQEEQTRGQLIRAVYEAVKAGKLSGVHGRLGDLGTIPKKYDIAVSTACGFLDAIIVDKTEDAQRVIEFIRQNQLGRTTCIALDKIEERRRYMEQKVDPPEGVPRLFDLIKPSDEKFRIAFYYALGNTLVSKDLDQATRVSGSGRNRWRVVTEKGQLVDISGTMSGGGNTVQKGGMRASLCMYSAEEVKEMLAAAERASARLAQIRQEKQALEGALQDTEREIQEYDFRGQKGRMEIESLQKQMEAFATRLKSLKVPTLNAGEKGRIKELDKTIAAHQEELKEIQQEHDTVDAEVKRLTGQILNIGGDELKMAKKKYSESEKECEDLRKAAKTALLDADVKLKNAKQAETNSKAALADKGVAEKQLQNLRAEHAKLDDKAEAVLNSHNQLKEQLTEADQVLHKLRAEREEVMKEASECKNGQGDLAIQLENQEKEWNDAKRAMQAWSGKLEEARQEYSQLPLELLKELRALAAEDEGEAPPEDMGQELGKRAIAQPLKPEELDAVVPADIHTRMTALSENQKNLKPNLSSIEEFKKADGEYRVKKQEYDHVNTLREKAREEHSAFKQKRLDEFMDGFSVISMKLKEMYQMITLGGDAELELVDTLDPFSEGINFSVRPPKKSWKQITNLSGGEKTLASLSLVFALHHYKPTPLYFMDEIDAALDFRNVSIIANYIKERTKNAQFIVISLRNHMFELADLLVGIYKTEDISKAVAINPTAFEVSKPPLQVKDGNSELERSARKRAVSAIEGPMGPPSATKRRAVPAAA